MIKETTYGIIPLRKDENNWQVLLVNHVKGNYWGFPKGHSKPGETPQETAVRELFEETGLAIKYFLAIKPLHETYDFYREKQPICKDVFYFLAEVEGQVILQPAETHANLWVNLRSAEEVITFPQSKALVREVFNKLNSP